MLFIYQNYYFIFQFTFEMQLLQWVCGFWNRINRKKLSLKGVLRRLRDLDWSEYGERTQGYYSVASLQQHRPWFEWCSASNSYVLRWLRELLSRIPLESCCWAWGSSAQLPCWRITSVLSRNIPERIVSQATTLDIRTVW